jgi:hypothetical protein
VTPTRVRGDAGSPRPRSFASPFMGTHHDFLIYFPRRRAVIMRRRVSPQHNRVERVRITTTRVWCYPSVTAINTPLIVSVTARATETRRRDFYRPCTDPLIPFTLPLP